MTGIPRLNITNNTPQPIKATVRLDGEDIHVAISEYIRDEVLKSYGLPPTIYGKPVVAVEPVPDNPTWRVGPALWPHQEGVMRRIVGGDDAKSLAVRIDTLKREIAAETPYAFVVWFVSGRRELYRPGNVDLRQPDAAYAPGAVMPDAYVPLFVPQRPAYHRGNMSHAVAMHHIRAGAASALIETKPGQWQLRDTDNNTWEVTT